METDGPLPDTTSLRLRGERLKNALLMRAPSINYSDELSQWFADIGIYLMRLGNLISDEGDQTEDVHLDDLFDQIQTDLWEPHEQEVLDPEEVAVFIDKAMNEAGINLLSQERPRHDEATAVPPAETPAFSTPDWSQLDLQFCPSCAYPLAEISKRIIEQFDGTKKIEQYWRCKRCDAYFMRFA